ncbi:hypothetical protein BC829DRAFT_168811 [Chytridium lagenaria]|nr:hypothetical protein BC829DRAFT_168811 [Chytridium lagenaria]
MLLQPGPRLNMQKDTALPLAAKCRGSRVGDTVTNVPITLSSDDGNVLVVGELGAGEGISAKGGEGDKVTDLEDAVTRTSSVLETTITPTKRRIQEVKTLVDKSSSLNVDHGGSEESHQAHVTVEKEVSDHTVKDEGSDERALSSSHLRTRPKPKTPWTASPASARLSRSIKLSMSLLMHSWGLEELDSRLQGNRGTELDGVERVNQDRLVEKSFPKAVACSSERTSE